MQVDRGSQPVIARSSVTRNAVCGIRLYCGALKNAGADRAAAGSLDDARAIGKSNLSCDVIVVNRFSHQVIVFE